jgi:DNA polymerase elongation subunit (family B)
MPNKMILQPCDWYEHDTSGSYVVDVFGRTDAGTVACVRIKNFKPSFYVKGPRPTVGSKVTAEKKYDVFAGFNDLKLTDVWRVECNSKAEFMEAVKECDMIRCAKCTDTFQNYDQWKRHLARAHSGVNESECKAPRTILYESNLPPFLRLFHSRHLGPASPISFVPHTFSIPVDRETQVPLYNIDEFYQCDFTEVSPAEGNIPLKVACYDLEMYSKSGMFPQAKKGDPIVQIGISYRWSDKMLDPIRRVVFVVGTVDASEDPSVEFVPCDDEEDMLRAFCDEVRGQNPDVMCGYNTFGFDDAYIEDRCRELMIEDEIDLSRYQSKTKVKNQKTQVEEWKVKFSETKKFELASGKYDLRYLMLRGRLGLDLLLNMRREHSLDSFKLDSIAGVFLKDKVVKYDAGRISSKSTRGLRAGNYVTFVVVGNTSDPYREGEKYVVTSVDAKGFTVDAPADLFDDLDASQRNSVEWTFAKDDVEPHELFELHANGGPTGRARIAKYCIQDCDLVLTLMAKLDTLVNARGMADVCKVPMDFVLRRGQGIKIFSAVVYYASQRNQILQAQSAMDGDTGYEGAIVLPPKIGMYLDQPISVLDFNSLYPTNMISYNLSPDTLVCEREFDADGNKVSHLGMKAEELATMKERGYVFEDVEYDLKDDKGVITGKVSCTYVQKDAALPMTEGVLPKTLDILLKKRKEFKEKMEDEQYDEAQRSVFNGLQLAYKVVANSVYGQTGSRTSPIRKLCVAACTTAAGRKALNLAKHIAESEFGATVVYGDTDSIFIQFPTKDLAKSIELGIAAGKRITSQCRKPYKIAYEKTFYPFILFCRKRYVGMMYEEDPNAKPKRKSMGIVLKRRDNAPIVKDVFGGALDTLMVEKDVKKAQAFVNQKLLDVLQNRVPLEKFIISKSLRDDYKNPGQIAHRVLADRMAARDPGTAPKVGDRLQFVFVAENKDKGKQGERIEEVGYVRANGLTPDAQFYITNQIQNPVAQLFALCIDKLDGYVPPRRPSYTTMYEGFLEKYSGDEEEATRALLEKKEKQLDSLMFMKSPALSNALRRTVRGPLDVFFGAATSARGQSSGASAPRSGR